MPTQTQKPTESSVRGKVWKEFKRVLRETPLEEVPLFPCNSPMKFLLLSFTRPKDPLRKTLNVALEVDLSKLILEWLLGNEHFRECIGCEKIAEWLVERIDPSVRMELEEFLSQRGKRRLKG